MGFFDQVQDGVFMGLLVETVVTLIILGVTTIWAKIFFKPEDKAEQTWLNKVLFYLKLLALGSLIFLSVVFYWIWDDIKGDVRGYIVDNAKGLFIKTEPSSTVITPPAAQSEAKQEHASAPIKKVVLMANEPSAQAEDTPKTTQPIEAEQPTATKETAKTELEQAAEATETAKTEVKQEQASSGSQSSSPAQTTQVKEHKIKLTTNAVPQAPINTLRKRLRKNAVV